ncbi:coatomer subunit epsilon-1-like [Gossypium australe]|uniref:Coatomer subunit epsilon-1-like n=1 Tax=Gossypium australe TaxID=47621 RepID=A0A5B6WQG6_9ROSI|nr:coatomer subunit epsilon-1-like [Gossypium australe]
MIWLLFWFDYDPVNRTDYSKCDAKDPETLANLVVCGLHLGKSSSRYLSQLKLTHPEHILVKRASSAEDSFERAVQSVA